MDGYRFVSGFPLVGSLCLLIAAVVGMGATGTAACGLALIAIDTGSPVWLLAATWRDADFWDA